MLFLYFSVLFSSIFLCNGQLVYMDTLDDRIQRVFSTGNRGTFDMIVTPEPNVQPTQSPQYIQNGNGGSCKCVPYYECPETPNADTTESRFFGEIDVRYNPESCQDVLDVCCPMGGQSSVPIAPPQNQMAKPPPIINPNTQQASVNNTCGVRNVNGIDFTVVGNGNEAGFAEFPWMVNFVIFWIKKYLLSVNVFHFISLKNFKAFSYFIIQKQGD